MNAAEQEKLRGCLRKIVADTLGVQMEAVTDTVHLSQDLGADSLDMLEIVMLIEDTLGIAIADEDAEAMYRAGPLSGLFELVDKEVIAQGRTK